MEKKVAKKFYWVIKDFSSLQSDKFYSVPVLIGDCKWHLLAFPKGNNGNHLSLYLDVADSEALPWGWKKYVKLRLTLVNQLPPNLSIIKEAEHCFDGKSTSWGFPAMIHLTKLHGENGGFLVNNKVMIFAEVEVFEVIDTLGETEKSEKAYEFLSNKKENVGAESNDLLKKINLVNGTQHVENYGKSTLKKTLLKTFLYLLKKLMKIVFFIFLFLLILMALGVTVLVAEKNAGRI